MSPLRHEIEQLVAAANEPFRQRRPHETYDGIAAREGIVTPTVLYAQIKALIDAAEASGAHPEDVHACRALGVGYARWREDRYQLVLPSKCT